MPTPLLIICIVLAAFAILIIFALSLKGTLTIIYNEEFSIYFSILFFKFKLFPFKEKRKKHRVRHISRRRAAKIKKKYADRPSDFLETVANFIKKFKGKKTKDTKKQPKKEGTKQQEGKKDTSSFRLNANDVSGILDILSLTVELVALTVKRFSKRLRIKAALLKITVASPDAATTAIAYGAVTQAVNVLLPLLREIKNFTMPSRKNFDIGYDFTADKPKIDMKLSFSLRVWHLLDIPFPAIKRTIPEIPKYIEQIISIINRSAQQNADSSKNENNKNNINQKS